MANPGYSKYGQKGNKNPSSPTMLESIFKHLDVESIIRLRILDDGCKKVAEQELRKRSVPEHIIQAMKSATESKLRARIPSAKCCGAGRNVTIKFRFRR